MFPEINLFLDEILSLVIIDDESGQFQPIKGQFKEIDNILD